MAQNPSKVLQYKQKSAASYHIFRKLHSTLQWNRDFLPAFWDEFDTIEKDSLKLTAGIQKTYASQNKCNRKTKKTFDYEGENTECTGSLEDARESFRIGWNLTSNH